MRRSVAATLFLAGVAGCADGPEPVAPVDRLTTNASVVTVDTMDSFDIPEDASRPEEHLSRKVARQVPGFGGFSSDSTGALIVYLKNPGNRSEERAVRALLAEYQGNHGRLMRERGRSAEVIIRKADYSFAQLNRYRSRINDAVLATPGVVFTDLDELANRFVVGLDRTKAPSARAAVEQIARRRGVPSEAVSYELRLATPVDECRVDDLYCVPESDPCVVNPLDPACSGEEAATGAGTDIRGRVRPIMGGIQTQNKSTSAVATLGFVAYYCVQEDVSTLFTGCGYWYVVTSHQTDKMATVDRAAFYQPNTFYDGEHIATEAIDTRWHSHPFVVNPEGLVEGGSATCEPVTQYRSLACRRSDMALLQPKTNEFTYGYLARPKRRYTDSYEYGDEQFAIDPSNGRLKIVGETTIPVGATVDKIGITTGWRSGQVSRVCVDILRIPSTDIWRYVLRCQTEMKIYSRRGDSGGPVFWYHPNDGTVSLAGLFHGYSYGNQDESYSYYSPMSMIRNDLGLSYNDRTSFRVFP